MMKTNSCLNTEAIIKYVMERAPERLHELFDGLDEELGEIEDKKEFLSDPNNWVSSGVLVRLYENAKKIFHDDEIAYKMGYESIIRRRFGYVQKILIYAFGKPSKILQYAQKVNDKFNKTKTIHIRHIGEEDAVLELRWHQGIRLSRDFCLFNQGIYSAIPTIWGGRSCLVEEHRCFFKGDPCCEYHLSWKNQSVFKAKIFQLMAPWKIAKESIRELEHDKAILQDKYEKIHALNKELQVKIDQLSALYETSTAILSTLDLTELLDTVLKRMMAIAKLDRAGVFLVDERGKSLSLIHAAGIDRQVLERLKSYSIPIDKKNNIIARAARSKRPILVEDVDSITLNRRNPLLRAFKPKAFVIVPLTVKGEVLGILVGDNAKDKNFIKAVDREFLSSFANHIAMAIENANLYKRIETSEKKYRQIVENINEGILVMTEGGSVIFANTKMKQMIGTGSLKGLNIYDLVPEEEDRKKLVSLMMANYQGDQAKEELTFRSADGDRLVPALMSSVPIVDEEGAMTGCLAVITDLTHQKELERKLLQAQKLESIGTMAGGIAHDFNNILTGILGFTTLLKEKAKDRPDLERFAEIIEKSSLRAADLVKKMLVFSRDSGSADEAVCAPAPVVDEVVALMKSSFPKNISIEVKIADDVPDIRCGSSQFQQILMNLCINARDAMSAGGTITIEACTVSHSRLPYVVRKRISGDLFVKVSVEDSGTGIPPEILERIFDPFFTTKDVGKGSGLGLAMVYGIMEGIGGAIDVRTKVGIGTSFDLYFPVATRKADADRESEQPASLKGKETVLVVDDEELIRVLACEILEPCGFKIVTSANGREAVESYKEMFPEIDIVLMDVLMPEMDGIQAAKEIKAFDADAKILFCSGYSSLSDLSEVLPPGTDRDVPYLVKKPFNPAELAVAIKDVLKG